MKQLIHKNPNQQQFLEDKKKLLTFLSEKFGELASYKNSNFNPYPVVLEDYLLKQVNEIADLLIEVIPKLVDDYLSNKEIQETVQLPEKAIELWKKTSKKRYLIGSARPDFLISKNNQVKICEINARFPTNGFILSYFLSKIMQQDIHYQNGIIDQNQKIISSLLSNFELSRPIIVLIDQEEKNSYDIKLLKNQIEELAEAKIHFNTPRQLILTEQGIYNGEVYCDQFILELNQQELINLSTELLEEIIINCQYFNDIRTIFLVHDKRFLSVLGNEEITRKYLSIEKAAKLREYIVVTHSLKQVKEKVIKNPTDWILKKYSGGKGEGMYVGRDGGDKQEFEKIINSLLEHYVAQNYVEQESFSIFNNDWQKMHIVGIILIFNNYYLGPGFFRGSQGNIVNVSRHGGVIIVPLRKYKEQ